MVEISGRPIIWHIMKCFSAQGFNEFIICCGYKGIEIKKFFCNYRRYVSDITISLDTGEIEFHRDHSESWKITLIETGGDTLTGGRLKRVAEYLGGQPFVMTYGDGLSDVDISDLVSFHYQHGKKATVTAVRPSGRFGSLVLDKSSKVRGFHEKVEGATSWINGGFFVLDPSCLDYIEHDYISWEGEPVQRLLMENQLMAYRHTGFWQAMDTLREKKILENLWDDGSAPWKLW